MFPWVCSHLLNAQLLDLCNKISGKIHLNSDFIKKHNKELGQARQEDACQTVCFIRSHVIGFGKHS